MVIIVIIINLFFHVISLHWYAHLIIAVLLILFHPRLVWLLFTHSICVDLLLKGCLLIIMDIYLPILLLILLFKQVLILKLTQLFQSMFMLVLIMSEQVIILLFILQMVLMAGFKFAFILVFIYYFLPLLDDLILFLL